MVFFIFGLCKQISALIVPPFRSFVALFQIGLRNRLRFLLKLIIFHLFGTNFLGKNRGIRSTVSATARDCHVCATSGVNKYH